MQKLIRDSSELVARHPLLGLSPTAEIEVDLAAPCQIDQLADIARREIPGVSVTAAGLQRFLENDPEAIFVFQRRQKILGGAAFLYLNERGFDALLLDDIDLKQPGVEFLARAGEPVSAIYFWALAGYGRAVIGLGNIIAYQRRPRFAEADYFAQPATAAGLALMKTLGFQPTPSFQPDLWNYPRSSPVPGRLAPDHPASGAFHHAQL